MNKPHDFENTELNIEDKVIFVPCQGCTLKRGKVIGFSPKMIRIEGTNIYKYGSKKGQSYTSEYLRFPADICKL